MSAALTPEQRAAIEARDHDVFCEAGAGTGKTRVLVERYCEAVCVDGVEVEAILAFTFTERAAAELRERIRRALMARARAARESGDDALAAELGGHARATERAWVTTIHGFCRRLLAAHPVAAGLDPRFRVLEAAEAERLRQRAFTLALAELMEHGSHDVVRAAAAYKPFRLAKMTLGAHGRLRSQGMNSPRLPPVSEIVRSVKDEAEPEPLSPAELEAAGVARSAMEALLEGFGERYARLKAERSGLDFADLELRALALLRDSRAVREDWRERFAHVLVDEFQDTNRVQLDLIEQLRGGGTHLFCVGDENQSIYRFRNADLQVFRERRSEARADPRTEVLALRGNFRTLPSPLAAVNEVGSVLLEGFPGLTWGRQAPPSGEPAGSAELLLTRAERRGELSWSTEGLELDPPPSEGNAASVAEARFLARRLRELVDAGDAARGDIVVLLRAFTHVDAFEEALARAGLDPYVVGGRGYWSQQQVEDLVRLLGCISNPLDDELLFGALASPAAGVRPDALWLLRRAAKPGRHIWPLVEWRYGGSAREPHDPDPEWLDDVPAEDAERLQRFCSILAPLRAEAPLIELEVLIERAMVAFGYDLALLARPGGPGRMANVRKLMRLAREFERHEGRDLAGFLLAAAESAGRDEREGMAPVRAESHDGVRVMTAHAAKGLEFPVVAVPDLGRSLNAGHTWDDLMIGPVPREPGQPRRFGMRLAFPSSDSFGLWELDRLGREESVASSEEGCRLVYVAATRAEDRLILSGCYSEGDLTAPEQRPGDSPLRRLLPALTERGWDGGEGSIGLAAPQRAEGMEPAEPSEAALPLRVAVNHPSPERANLLREWLPAAGASGPEDSGGPPPLMGERPREVPVGHLSYSALAEYERCGYRFYVERLLGVRPGAMVAAEAPNAGSGPSGPDEDLDRWEVSDPTDSEAASAPVPERTRALAVGNAAHAALERSIREEWDAPDESVVDALLASEGLAADADARRRVLAGVGAWVGCGVRAGLEGWTLRPEVPFVLGVGGTVIRGQIDLLAEGPDGHRVVVDFKTDALRGRSPAELAGRYAAQREVYALAAAGDGSGPLRTVHLFLEGVDEPVVQEFAEAELGSARERLGALIEAIRGGAFAPTEDPTSAVCFGCPAAARLCPHPAWRPPAGPGARPDPGADEETGEDEEPGGVQEPLFE
ncbi:MAG: UvrD-helicase domain-containing protein [Solirubrobacterales bacterium]